MSKPRVPILVLVSGGGTNLQALLDAQEEGRLGPGCITAVLSDRPAVYALERARRAGIPVILEECDKSLPKGSRRRDLSDRILTHARKLGVELIVLAGFLSILEGTLVAEYSGRMINLHPSLLPKFGGAGMYGDRVHRAVLDAGERESGCTVHLVDAGTDTGPPLIQRRVPVLYGDTPKSLGERIHREEHIAIVEATALMAGRIQGGKAMRRRALISVYDKEGVLDLAGYLSGAGWDLLSTGGTAKHLKEHGIPVIDLSTVTGFPECLDGRVKTLHPAVHAGILARRDEPSHMDTLSSLGLFTIDLVCVNLYPFFEKVQAGLSLGETVEFIDIGGPTMLRSAAKNYRDVLVLTDPGDYAQAIASLREGSVSEDFRKRLAGKVFNLTAAYDAAIARYLLQEEYPSFWPMSLKKSQALRYGENGHQSAALYLSTDRPGALGAMRQIQGKELSYNNIRDLDLAWKAASAFGIPSAGVEPLGTSEVTRLIGGWAVGGVRPACVAVKHNTPCGVAVADSLLEAYEKVHACDPVSIFGGIVACTVAVDGAVAEKLSELFLEIVVAPGFSDEALRIFSAKKNLRLMVATGGPSDVLECIAVDGGLLVQSADRKLLEKWEVVTQAAPQTLDIGDLLFGMRAVAYVKSNAIMVVKDGAAVGIGGGQTNRIWAASQALERAAAVVKTPTDEGTIKASFPRVLASDAFFPFPDVVEIAAAAGIKAIIQPGGSLRDKESIEACDRLGIAMVCTGTRHFKH